MEHRIDIVKCALRQRLVRYKKPTLIESPAEFNVMVSIARRYPGMFQTFTEREIRTESSGIKEWPALANTFAGGVVASIDFKQI